MLFIIIEDSEHAPNRQLQNGSFRSQTLIAPSGARWIFFRVGWGWHRIPSYQPQCVEMLAG